MGNIYRFSNELDYHKRLYRVRYSLLLREEYYRSILLLLAPYKCTCFGSVEMSVLTYLFKIDIVGTRNIPV